MSAGTNILAAVAEHAGAPFTLESVELGDCRSDEVVVDIRAVGICHTDLLARAGAFPTPLPAVLGHEGAGMVRSVGAEVTRVEPGDHVALSFASCGACPTCRTSRPYNCHEFMPRNFGASRMDGTTALQRGGAPLHSQFFGQSSFATAAIVPERSAVKIPTDIPFHVAAPFGCGIQTGAGAVLNAFDAQPGSTLAVFGTGGVGMAAIMAARHAGCSTIIGVDRSADRLALAAKLGATHTVNVADDDPADAVGRITGYGADFTIDTTGSPTVLRTAVEVTAPAGTCGIIGAPPFGTDVALDVNGILGPGRTIMGIVEGCSVPEVFIPRLLGLWQRGELPVDTLIETFPLDQIQEAAERSERGEVVKPVLLTA